MTEQAVAALKNAATEAAQGTVRGAGSTVGWGAVLWYFAVEQTYGDNGWRLLVSDRHPANLGTYFIVGVATAVLTGWFRLMEQRHPGSLWSTVMFSKGAPTYNPATQPSQPEPASDDSSPVVIPDPAAPGLSVAPMAVPAVADPASFDTSNTPVAVDADDLLESH